MESGGRTREEDLRKEVGGLLLGEGPLVDDPVEQLACATEARDKGV